MGWRIGGTAGVLVALLGLGACVEPGPTAADLAVATCGLPLELELDLPAGQTWDRSEVGVEHLGEGAYRVTGIVTVRTDGSADVTDRPFTCELAPDSSDERGFRVTSLEVGQGVTVG